MHPLSLSALAAAGLSADRIEQHITAGRAGVDGELVTDLDGSRTSPDAGRDLDGVTARRGYPS